MAIRFRNSNKTLPDELSGYIDYEFYAYLCNEGFALTKIRGDGNWLFRAVADLMVEDQEKHPRYRRLALQHMQLNKKDFESFLTTSDGGFDDYIERMSQNGIWGGHVELVALSTVLNKTFYIVDDKKNSISISNCNLQPNSTSILYLAYDTNALHYSSLRKNLEGIKEEGKEMKNTLGSKRKWNDLEAEEKYSVNDQITTEKVPIKRNFRKIIFTKEEPKKKSFTNPDEINFKDIFNKRDEELILWCEDIGLIKRPNYCKVCRGRSGKINRYKLISMKNYSDGYVWRCQQKECRNIQYIRKDNKLLETFSRVKLRILLLYIFSHYSFLVSASISSKTLGLSLRVIREVSDLLTSWIVEFQKLDEIFRGKFGGVNKIVEIDESCFFKRKYNKGRWTEQIWGFGMVERESGRLLVEVVEKRNAKTLIPIIKKWISVDSKYVISDEWRSYNKLRDLKYNHHKVNHSKNFVDQENPLIHTQTIENRWGQIKAIMKKRGRISRISFPEKLKEITWRIANKNAIQSNLLKVILHFNNYHNVI